MADSFAIKIKRIKQGEPVSGGQGQWPVPPGAPSDRGGNPPAPFGKKLSATMRKKMNSMMA